jgi:hypothetical protein
MSSRPMRKCSPHGPARRRKRTTSSAPPRAANASPKIAVTTPKAIVSPVGDPAARAAARSFGRLKIPPRKNSTPTSPTIAEPIARTRFAPAPAPRRRPERRAEKVAQRVRCHETRGRQRDRRRVRHRRHTRTRALRRRSQQECRQRRSGEADGRVLKEVQRSRFPSSEAAKTGG